MSTRTSLDRAAQRAAFVVPDQELLAGTGYSYRADRLAKFWEGLDRSRKPEVKLLKEHLSPMQMSEARRTGLVPVVGSLGGHWLVQLFPDGRGMRTRARSRCLVFYDTGMPLLDWAVGKILLLEADELAVEKCAI